MDRKYRELSLLYFLELLIGNLPLDQFLENEFWKFVCNSPQCMKIFEGEDQIILPKIEAMETNLFWEFVHDHDWASDFLKLVESKKNPIGLKEFLQPKRFKTVNGSKPVEVFSEAVSIFVWLFSAYRSGNFCGFVIGKTRKKAHSNNKNKFVERIFVLLNRGMSWFEIANELKLPIDELRSLLEANRDSFSGDFVRSKIEAFLSGDYVKKDFGWIHPSGLFLDNFTKENLLSLIRESGMTEKDFFAYLWEVKYEIGAINKLEKFLRMESRLIVSLVRYYRGTLSLSSLNISPPLR